ncbi:MAG: ATP-dependent 6-phosphofructokinase, partial [Nitrospiraceae bacterium]|nr:ATP-dependent 6-phosphofructokinase [Nitrospiraceae bacterium]
MKRIGVLTSGGDSPGMNAGIRAVVRTAIHSGLEVFGIKRGYQGLIDGDVTPMDARSVSGLVGRGGTVLFSARCKPFYEPEGRAAAAECLAKHQIEGLVVIGGDGSYRGALKLHAEHGIRCIGMPGTIDNDIGGTDFTIGYDTALNIAVEAIDRIRDTATSHGRIFFVEVMGRHSGYLAMMSGIAGGAEEILVPETPTDLPALVKKLREMREKGKRSCIVVVAEGDDAGHAIDVAREVSKNAEFEDSRVSVIGHMQRGMVAGLLEREHPQTVALILSTQTPDHSSAIISHLPEEIQSDVIYRIATLDSVSPGVIDRIEDALHREIGVVVGTQDQRQVGGIPKVVEILDHMENNLDADILDNLEEVDPDMVEEIRKQMFTFEDLTAVDGRSLQMILREVNNDSLTLALKTASDELRENIYSNMSARAADMIRDDLEALGPVQIG